jgi:tRNA threonylcarbamoyladenosine biosynthesis protein TsaE
MKKFISHSANETLKLGQLLAKDLYGGEVLALIGDLGSGKTILTKGLAKGLGIKKIVNSPTFVLMKIYKIKNLKSRKMTRGSSQDLLGLKIRNFIHIDAYRLTAGKDLVDIGIEDWLNKKNTVVIIEWADRVKDILPKKAITIKIKINRQKSIREFIIN